MNDSVNAAPTWLRVLSMVVTPVAVMALVLGVAMLVLPGPGLLVVLIGLALGAPWVIIRYGPTATRR